MGLQKTKQNKKTFACLFLVQLKVCNFETVGLTVLIYGALQLKD